METYKFLQVFVEKGYTVYEYESNYCISKGNKAEVIITLPKKEWLSKKIVDAIKKMLTDI